MALQKVPRKGLEPFSVGMHRHFRLICSIIDHLWIEVFLTELLATMGLVKFRHGFQIAILILQKMILKFQKF